MLRRATLALLAAIALPLAAQQPPLLEPLPEAPPPPPGVSGDDVTEAPIKITPGTNEQIEETVIEGKRVVRVTNASGTVYYLVEERADQAAGRRESLDSGVRVPLWVIQEF